MKKIFTLGLFLIAANIHCATKSLDQLFLIQRSSDGNTTIISPKEVPAACLIKYKNNNLQKEKIIFFPFADQKNCIKDSNKIISIEPVETSSVDGILTTRDNNVNPD
jgi:hypothetical protein